ncbi:Protein saf4, variant 2 [Basidiobolus ranarum]
MKCHLCSGWIEIQTDPKNSRYVVTSGARQKEETWDPEENETIKFKDEDEAKKLSENAIFKLEHDVEDKRKADESKTLLTRLQDLNDKLWEDQYTHNQRLRKTFREEKKFLAEKKRQADEICERNSLSIPLLEEAQEDIIGAKLTNFADPVLEEAKRRKLEVSASPLFSKTVPSEVKKNQSPLSKLGATLALNTKLKMDPFLRKEDKFKEESKPLKKAIVRIKKTSLKGTDDSSIATVDSSSGNVLSALLNDYGDEESS